MLENADAEVDANNLRNVSGGGRTSFTWTGLWNGEGATYFFAVAASDGRRGEVSSVVEGKTLTATAAPAAVPGGISATAGSNAIGIRWNETADASSFDVQRRLGDASIGNTNPWLPLFDNVRATSLSDGSGISGQRYTYRVRARNNFGTTGSFGSWSTPSPGHSAIAPSNPLLGNWTGNLLGESATLVMTGNTWTLTCAALNGGAPMTGTYFVDGNNVTFYRNGLIQGGGTLRGTTLDLEIRTTSGNIPGTFTRS
jgi:hypothetical protein